jgi:hypothetical protein
MATQPNYWMQNVMGQNSYDGSSFALNPYQYANQQGTQFASDNLSRLLGGQAPQQHNVAPTMVPYQMPAQSDFGGEQRAADGTMLGGMNAGQVARLYSMYPRHVADQMMADEMRMLSGGAINPTVQMPGQTSQQAPVQQPAVSGARADATGARAALGGTGAAQGQFGSPQGTPTTWNPTTGGQGQTPVIPGGQPRTNPYAGMFGQAPSGGSQLPGGSQIPRVNPYNMPTGTGQTGYNPMQAQGPRQTTPFTPTWQGSQNPYAGPQNISPQSNPVFAMLQNVLGLRSSMGQQGPNLAPAGSPSPAANPLSGNYRATSTPAGYTRWQRQP